MATPDPDTFFKVSRCTSHFYRDALAKVGPLGRKYYIHQQLASPCGSHVYRDTLAEVLGIEGRLISTPNERHITEDPLRISSLFIQKNPRAHKNKIGTSPAKPKIPPLYMGKTGTIWQFFRALFPSTWRTLSPDALFTRIWDTRKHPESATFSCFPC